MPDLSKTVIDRNLGAPGVAPKENPVSPATERLLVLIRNLTEKQRTANEARLSPMEKWQKRMDESPLALRSEGYKGLFDAGQMYEINPLHGQGSPWKSETKWDLSKFPKQKKIRDKIRNREIVTEKEYSEMGKEWDNVELRSVSGDLTPSMVDADGVHIQYLRMRENRFGGEAWVFGDGATKRDLASSELRRINSFVESRKYWAKMNPPPEPGSEELYYPEDKSQPQSDLAPLLDARRRALEDLQERKEKENKTWRRPAGKN